MDIPLLKNLDVKDKKVLMRVDFNVPLTEDGKVIDDTRIRLALPSIEYVLLHGGKLILMSHLGRPKGKKNPKLSLKPVADHLSRLLGKPVQMASDTIGPEVTTLVKNLKESEVLLLENVRFYDGEEHPENDPSFAEELALLGDCYVNDAFGSAHRAHASTALLAKYFPKEKAMGFLMETEVDYLTQIVSEPKRPFYAIIGGAKIGSKLGVLKSLIKKVDKIFIGGGMAFTFFKAKNISIGDSIFEPEQLEEAKDFLESCKKQNVEVFLPKDLVIADAFSNDANRQTIEASAGIPDGWRGMDIGPKTFREWEPVLAKSQTIFWNGPMGVFEFSHFAEGTKGLAKLLGNIDANIIVGGGDSVAAINNMGLQKNFSHLSTGGGAALELIEFGYLPGLDSLAERSS